MPDFAIEEPYGKLVIGIDEAGRGPWVGPVVAGAVLFKNRSFNPKLFSSLNDSKKLSAKKREQIYEDLFTEQQKGNVLIGIGEASAQEIDDFNILQATFLAMSRACAKIDIKPDMVLVDGNKIPTTIKLPCRAIVQGDGKCCSIAAASIVAKVYRDRLMQKLAEKYPYYGFEKNAGYGTKAHIEGLKKYGITPEHRKSYKPIKELLNASKEQK